MEVPLMIHKGNQKTGKFTNLPQNNKYLQEEVQMAIKGYDFEEEIIDDCYSEYLWYLERQDDIIGCYNKHTYDIIQEVSRNKALADIDYCHNVGQSIYYNSDFFSWEERFAKSVPGFEVDKEVLMEEITNAFSQKIINDLLLLSHIDFNVYNDDRYVDYDDLLDQGWSGGPPMNIGVDATIYRIRDYTGDVEIDVATTPYSNRRRIRILITDDDILVTFDHYDTFYELEVIDGLVKLV